MGAGGGVEGMSANSKDHPLGRVGQGRERSLGPGALNPSPVPWQGLETKWSRMPRKEVGRGPLGLGVLVSSEASQCPGCVHVDAAPRL